MGNQASVEEEITPINHPKFKNIQYLNDYETVRTSIQVENQLHFRNWKDNLTQLTDVDEDVLLLPRAYSFHKTAFCGSSGIAQIEFDNYPFVLQEEIQSRIQQDKYFDEPELWYLIYDLVYSATVFKRMKKKVGDIRPANIFLNSEGQIKVANVFSWPSQTTNYEKTILSKEETYIAPEEVEGVKEGKLHLNVDQHVAESFSIGLTMLETASLQKASCLYKSKTFDKQQLDNMINNWKNLNISEDEKIKKTYSPLFKDVVIALCEVRPENRVTAEELFEWLCPFDSDISNLKPFSPPNPPQKVKPSKFQSFISQSPTAIFNSIKQYPTISMNPQKTPFSTNIVERKTVPPPRVQAQSYTPQQTNYMQTKSYIKPQPYIQPNIMQTESHIHSVNFSQKSPTTTPMMSEQKYHTPPQQQYTSTEQVKPFDSDFLKRIDEQLAMSKLNNP